MVRILRRKKIRYMTLENITADLGETGYGTYELD